MRRAATVVTLAVACVLTAAACAASGPSAPSAEDELRQRVRRGNLDERAQFTYIGGGTRVLDCVTRYRRYGGITDPGTGRFVIWLGEVPDAAGIVAIVDGAAVSLHRSLFDSPPFDDEWISFTKPLTADDGATLGNVVGQDLAAELMAPTPPPLGPAVVEAALVVASSVERTGFTVIGGRKVDGYRIEVDPDEFGDVVDPGTVGTDGADRRLLPLLEVWITVDDDVARIAVRSQRTDGTPGAAEEGWVTDYRSSDIEMPALDPAEVRDAATVQRSELRPPALECAVPI